MLQKSSLQPKTILRANYTTTVPFRSVPRTGLTLLPTALAHRMSQHTAIEFDQPLAKRLMQSRWNGHHHLGRDLIEHLAPFRAAAIEQNQSTMTPGTPATAACLPTSTDLVPRLATFFTIQSGATTSRGFEISSRMANQSEGGRLRQVPLPPQRRPSR